MKCSQCDETAPHTHDPELHKILKDLHEMASRHTGITEARMYDNRREIIMLDLVRQCRTHIESSSREAALVRLDILEDILTSVLVIERKGNAQTI